MDDACPHRAAVAISQPGGHIRADRYPDPDRAVAISRPGGHTRASRYRTLRQTCR